jgi:uncharacterized paraquat-inducible protein A
MQRYTHYRTPELSEGAREILAEHPLRDPTDLVWCECHSPVVVPRIKPRDSQEFRCPRCGRQLRVWRTT